MPEVSIAQFTTDDFEKHIAFVDGVAERYVSDTAFRDACEADGRAALESIGMSMDLPADVDIRVVVNTGDRAYMAMPPDPNIDLADEKLEVVAGGDTAGTAGTGATVSTMGSVPTTVSSAGTFGTAGTAG